MAQFESQKVKFDIETCIEIDQNYLLGLHPEPKQPKRQQAQVPDINIDFSGLMPDRRAPSSFKMGNLSNLLPDDDFLHD
jgi:hypothetical protein